jgi:hypothetical protein
MLTMIRRFFGFSEPADSNNDTRKRPYRKPTARASSGGAATSAPSAPTPTTGNQGADWLEMRRAAGWEGLEAKPDGRRGGTDD